MKRKGLSITLITAFLFLLAMPAVADSPADPAATYKAKCAMCHGADGAGQTPMGKNMKLRDLRSPEVQKLTDKELTALVTDGKGKMPAYKSKLGAGDITALVELIRKMAKK
jgi:cytochrome c6